MFCNLRQGPLVPREGELGGLGGGGGVPYFGRSGRTLIYLQKWNTLAELRDVWRDKICGFDKIFAIDNSKALFTCHPSQKV